MDFPFSSGILPCIKIKDQWHIVIGKEYHGWSGFSGNSEENETITQTAFREFHEETCNIFKDYFSLDYFSNNILHKLETCTPTNKKFIIFLVDFTNIEFDYFNINSTFQNNLKLTECKYLKEKSCIFCINCKNIHKFRLRPCFRRDVDKIMEVLQ